MTPFHGIFRNQKTPLNEKTQESLRRKADQLTEQIQLGDQEARLWEAGLEEWVDLQIAHAETLVLQMSEQRASHYAKAEAAGILRWWKRKKGELSIRVQPAYRQQLRSKLEEINDRLDQGTGGSTQPGRSVPFPFGEF